METILQEGDVIFRLSNTLLVGGLIDFSQEVAKATQSDFSHAVFVCQVDNGEVIVLDVTPKGVERKFLIDWYLDGCENIVVKRLKPEYQYLIPSLLEVATQAVKDDFLYDEHLIPDNDLFYCTELVDYCFRSIRHPLAPRIKIKDWPDYNLLVSTVCLIGGIDPNNEVVIAGNDEIGLFSSSMLETVIDFR